MMSGIREKEKYGLFIVERKVFQVYEHWAGIVSFVYGIWIYTQPQLQEIRDNATLEHIHSNLAFVEYKMVSTLENDFCGGERVMCRSITDEIGKEGCFLLTITKLWRGGWGRGTDGRTDCEGIKQKHAM